MASQSAGIGSALPDQLGYSGYVLTTDGTTASWEAVGVLPGVTSFGAVGAAPSANGATVSGAVATLQPADATHPGVVTALAQSFAGAKTFTSDLLVNNSGDKVMVGAPGGAGFPGIWLNQSSPASNNFCLGDFAGESYLNSPGAHLYIQIGNANKLILTATAADFTGLGVGNGIKLKSPDGTTYTLTVADGGTLVIT